MIIEPVKVTESAENSDIWGDSDDEVYRNNDEFYGVRPEVPENNDIVALRRIHAKQGYLAGISSQKEETLQNGFDNGYPVGASIGVEIGKIIGNLQILTTHSNSTVSEKAKELLIQAESELHIRKVLNKKYFDEDINIQSHPLINHWNDEVKLLLQEIK